MQKLRNILLEAVVLALLVTTAAVSLGQITVAAQKQACSYYARAWLATTRDARQASNHWMQSVTS